MSQDDSGTEGPWIEWKDFTLDRIEKKKYEAVRDKLTPAWRTVVDKYFSTRKNDVAEVNEIYKKRPGD